MVSLTAVFVFIFLVLNLMLWCMVIRPVTRLVAARRPGEPGREHGCARLRGEEPRRNRVLAQSFNRMKKSLVQAMKMLEADVRPT